MQETAGNEYMNESIDGIGITVYAVQDTVESDSYGKDYDKNADGTPALTPGSTMFRPMPRLRQDRHRH